MQEFIEKLMKRLEEEQKKQQYLFNNVLNNEHQRMIHEYAEQCYLYMTDIVNQLAEEHNNGWITDRNPTREECGEYGHAEFQVTIPQHKGNKTITMDFVYETVRGKEVARWKWCGILSAWEVLAWKPLDAPYQQKGE